MTEQIESYNAYLKARERYMYHKNRKKTDNKINRENAGQYSTVPLFIIRLKYNIEL